MVDDTDGAGGQIFSQAVRSAASLDLIEVTDQGSLKLSASTRYGQSRAASREVQDRHEDIKKIERTLEELAQLFNDVRLLFGTPMLPADG